MSSAAVESIVRKRNLMTGGDAAHTQTWGGTTCNMQENERMERLTSVPTWSVLNQPHRSSKRFFFSFTVFTLVFCLQTMQLYSLSFPPHPGMHM